VLAPCRYDGSVIPDPVVEIGLGVPRPPIRLVQGTPIRLVQPDTGRDLTAQMAAFSEEFLEGLPEVDGFILKNRSPRCALRDAKIHISENRPAVGRGPGLFGAAARAAFLGPRIGALIGALEYEFPCPLGNTPSSIPRGRRWGEPLWPTFYTHGLDLLKLDQSAKIRISSITS